MKILLKIMARQRDSNCCKKMEVIRTFVEPSILIGLNFCVRATKDTLIAC